MRIVTRPDFDGVVCSVLLYEAEPISKPVNWVSPNDMQRGLIEIKPSDIIANLPYDPRCTLWFDHHFSNRIHRPFKGLFELAPSAAGLVFRYYQNRFKRDFSELVNETDKIDSAGLSLDEILFPEHFPYVLLSMTIQSQVPSDEAYWNQLVALLRTQPIQMVMADFTVKNRCEIVKRENQRYKELLKSHTTLNHHIAVTDFRDFDSMPQGNRFLVYSMFPEASVSVKIGFHDKKKETMVIKIGHSILNQRCRVNIGQMLSYFEGGGHFGAGSCRFHASKTNTYLKKILDILSKNDPQGSIVVKKERGGLDRRVLKDRRRKTDSAYSNDPAEERRKNGPRRVTPEPRENGSPIEKCS
ncbi:MAG: exopolyphosphatase [Deltaproteobacteria bacterium]